MSFNCECKEKVRVRFAPSPTGFLHLGSARAALFNFLFAKKHNGKFILRIEDTDKERSKKEFEEDIINSLLYLGLSWDEFYRQSERIEIYKKYFEQLREKNLIYPCYCTEEELEQKRKESLKKKIPPRYDGKCKKLTEEEKEKLEKTRKPSFRFKVPESGYLKIRDVIKQDVNFDLSLIGDFIVARFDGSPSFIFANALDDALMEINFVIRGDDHLSNIPRQVLIYQALNFKIPNYAHIPMILAPDRTKLSKRYGAVSLKEYIDLGYLRESLINYLSLLGWSSPDGKEFFSKDELIEKFSLERVSKSGAIFDIKKLNWMNSHYIRNSDLDKIFSLSIPYLKKRFSLDKISEDKLKKIIDVGREGINCLIDLPENIEIFLKEEIDYEEEVLKNLKVKSAKEILEKFQEKIISLQNFEEQDILLLLKELPRQLNLLPSLVFITIRSCLTGRIKGPELYKIIYLFGKEKTMKIIKNVFENVIKE